MEELKSLLKEREKKYPRAYRKFSSPEEAKRYMQELVPRGVYELDGRRIKVVNYRKYGNPTIGFFYKPTYWMWIGGRWVKGAWELAPELIERIANGRGK